MELELIELSNIEEIIPNKLKSKFRQNEILTISDVLTTSLENFQNYPYVGKKVSQEFLEFRNLIQTQPEKIKQINFFHLPKTLPLNFNENSTFIELFENVINDYLELTEKFNHNSDKARKRQLRNIDIIKKNYGINSDKYDIDKIARRHKLNRERARQIIVNEFQGELRKLLNGEFLENWNFSLRKEVIEIINSFKIDLIGFSVFNKNEIKRLLEDYGYEDLIEKKEDYFELLINLWGYNLVPLSRYYQLRDNILYANDTIDYELFLKVSTRIFKYLESKVIITSLEDIIIDVLEVFDVEDEFIIQCCRVIDEIESPEPKFYQIRFDKLSSINDYAYRLIYEKQKPLSYNDLLHLINKRLVRFDLSITMESLKQTLRRDQFVVPIGKTGNWSLEILNTNVESQIDLILKSFRILDKPLTIDEITDFIHNNFSRTDVTKKSIGSNLRNYKKHFIKIEENRFILTEQKNQFKDKIVKTKEPRKKRAKLKATKTKEIIIRYLENESNKTWLLRDLVRTISTFDSEFSRMHIYGAISENPLIFKKFKGIDGKDYVSLNESNNKVQNDIAARYNWNETKKILERELNEIFNSPIQPQYETTLDQALDLFFKVITQQLPNDAKNLNGLAERILPTLYKFYAGASDRNDKLNYLKQIVTSQESFFKILLYYFYNSEFQTVKRHNKGFGAVLDNLTKIDNRENRYKELPQATKFEFGRHFSRAYKNRNIDAHNAKDWTEAQIIETKTSCLVIMIYACFEYSNEISRI